MQKTKIIYGANYQALESRINTFLKEVLHPVNSMQVVNCENELGEKYFIAVILYAD